MMTRQGIGLLAGVMGAALVLSGCVPGTSPFTKKNPDTAEAAASVDAQGIVTMEKDIEAPDTFSLTGEGLWDGRPSLGGVWVAHSSVKDPQRVLIRSTKNGKTVVGALFRRERENPGPSVQVSSDAAEGLGMLAGQPAELSVIALKRQEVDLTPASEVTPKTEAEAVAAANDASAPKVEGQSEGAGGGVDVASTDVATTDVASTDAASTEVASEGSIEAAPVEKKPGFFSKLFKRKPKAETALPADSSPQVANTATAGSIDQVPLDPVIGTAAAGIASAEAKQSPAAQVLTRAYVQIGIFSKEANANTAVGQMKKAGMTATVVPDQSNGKTYWRVIVGPAASVAERDALATRVKGVGYPDSYPVSK